jgi:hypothetical protein
VTKLSFTGILSFSEATAIADADMDNLEGKHQL